MADDNPPPKKERPRSRIMDRKIHPSGFSAFRPGPRLLGEALVAHYTPRTSSPLTLLPCTPGGGRTRVRDIVEWMEKAEGVGGSSPRGESPSPSSSVQGKSENKPEERATVEKTTPTEKKTEEYAPLPLLEYKRLFANRPLGRCLDEHEGVVVTSGDEEEEQTTIMTDPAFDDAFLVEDDGPDERQRLTTDPPPYGNENRTVKKLVLRVRDSAGKISSVDSDETVTAARYESSGTDDTRVGSGGGEDGRGLDDTPKTKFPPSPDYPPPPVPTAPPPIPPRSIARLEATTTTTTTTKTTAPIKIESRRAAFWARVRAYLYIPDAELEEYAREQEEIRARAACRQCTEYAAVTYVEQQPERSPMRRRSAMVAPLSIGGGGGRGHKHSVTSGRSTDEKMSELSEFLGVDECD